MKYLGAHVSIAGGIQNAPLNAREIGATAFALFTKNQRQWHARPYTPEEIQGFKANLQETGIQAEHVLPHDSYLINIASPKLETREKSLAALYEETLRTGQLGLTFLNFHPGSHLKQMGEEECLDLIAQGMNQVIRKTTGVVLVLETTAGQGSNVGYSFEQLAYIIAKVENRERVGVCMDTCHIFAAGYDLRTAESYQKTMDQFESSIGFSYLKGVHLNDSKFELGSRKDRHESLGKGKLGWEPFKLMMRDSRFDNMPLVLETVDPSIWADEIKTLRGFAGQL